MLSPAARKYRKTGFSVLASYFVLFPVFVFALRMLAAKLSYRAANRGVC